VSAINIDEIVETLSKLSVLEIAKLKAALEEKWGVKAQAAVAQVVAAAPAPAQEAKGEAASEATDVKVTLESAPADKKIGIIKVVREVTGLGLKEAKDIVDATPKVIKESVPKAEGDEIAKKIEAAGGKVSLKGL
jgi:large subunit ribosomal protein L7/L12